MRARDARVHEALDLRVRLHERNERLEAALATGEDIRKKIVLVTEVR